MTPISQRAANIKSNQLGTCPNENFGSSGCKLVALASMYDLDPVELNKQFIRDGVYIDGCMISDPLAAVSLKVEYYGKTTTMPKEMAIAETDNYASSGVPQHFFVWLGQGNMIMDPLTGTVKTNNYHIVSFRLFKERTNMEELEHLAFNILEHEWRKEKNMAVPNADSIKKEIHDRMSQWKTNEWVFAGLQDKWFTEAKLKYPPYPVGTVCPALPVKNCTTEIAGAVKAEQNRIFNNLVK